MPAKFLILALFHHSVSFAIVIPANILYGENKVYAEMIYFLSFGAGAALLIR